MLNLGPVRKSHERLIADHERMVRKVGKAAAERGEKHVQVSPGFTPRTGALQKSTKGTVLARVGGVLVRLKASKGYASYVEHGTAPHEIRARSGGMLRFYWAKAGRWVAFKKVNHPGTRPTRFLSRARDSAYAWAGQALRRDMQRVARRF